MNPIYEVRSRELTESPPKGWGRGKYRKTGRSAERRTREGYSEDCQESVCLTVIPSLSLLAALWDN